MSNFLFLTGEFRSIGQEAQEAEQLTLLSPKAASVLIRSAMEKAVRWMFDHDYDLEYPYDRNLSSWLHLPDLREIISECRFLELSLIRKTSNLGTHGSTVKMEDAFMVLRYLHSFLGRVARSYAEGDEVTVPTFDGSRPPTGNVAKESESRVR
jgi:type I restriction enzyme R subunit